MATHDELAANANAVFELTRDEARLVLKGLSMARNGRRFEFRTGDRKAEQKQASLLTMLDDLDKRLRATFEL